MNFQSITRFLILICGMLLANLLATYIDSFFMEYKGQFSPELFTLIGMAVVVAVYYPLFTRLDAWSIKTTQKFIKAGKALSGRKTGSIVALIAILLALYYYYGKLWFNQNLILRLF